MQLEVKHNDSAAWTEQIEAIEERTEAISERTEQLVNQVAHLQLQNAREEIDRQWDRERERYLIRQKNGRQTEPSYGGAILGTCIMTVMGFVFGAAMHPAFGVVIVVVAVGVGLFGMQRATQFEQARQRYQQRKSNLRLNDFRPDCGNAAGTDLFTPERGNTNFSQWEDSR